MERGQAELLIPVEEALVLKKPDEILIKLFNKLSLLIVDVK